MQKRSCREREMIDMRERFGVKTDWGQDRLRLGNLGAAISYQSRPDPILSPMPSGGVQARIRGPARRFRGSNAVDGTGTARARDSAGGRPEGYRQHRDDDKTK